jgi:endonuclease-3
MWGFPLYKVFVEKSILMEFPWRFQVVNIDLIIRLLEKHYKQYSEPIVTRIGKENHPFKVLISTILSLRTKDAVTAKATLNLFRLASTPSGMLGLSEEDIQKAIYPVGFYKTKARTIRHISSALLEQYGGEVPDELEELLKLRGVGRKTANLVLIEGFGKPGMCVDTHVHRISNRLGLVKTKTPYETEFALRELLPQKYWNRYNTLLVAHGQNTCTPISPKCSLCMLSPSCGKVGVEKHR